MTINELIRNRRAVPPRFFNKNEVSNDIVRQILENATHAPTHKMTEPWKFLVFKGQPKESMVNEVSRILQESAADGTPVNQNTIGKFTGNLEKAAVVVVLVLERDQATRIPEWEEIAAVACAVQNMWLTATSLSLSAFWSTPAYSAMLDSYFGITGQQKCLGFFLLGYSDLELPSTGRTPVDEKTEWHV